MKQIFSSVLLVFALAIASFALSFEAKNQASPDREAVSAMAIDTAAEPANVQTDSIRAVYSAVEVDIGSLAARRHVVVQRTFAPSYAEYAIEVEYAYISPILLKRSVNGIGFSGLGGDHYARADV